MTIGRLTMLSKIPSNLIKLASYAIISSFKMSMFFKSLSVKIANINKQDAKNKGLAIKQTRLFTVEIGHLKSLSLFLWLKLPDKSNVTNTHNPYLPKYQ